MESPLTIAEGGRAVLADFGAGPARFAARWMRHNSTDKATIATAGGQRALDFIDLDQQVTVTGVDRIEPDTAWLTYSDSDIVRPIPLALLRRLTAERDQTAPSGLVPAHAVRAKQLVRAPYAEISIDPSAHLALLDAFVRDGAVMVTGTPVEPGKIADLAGLFGMLRPTNYGVWFDVRVQSDPNNLADSPLGLPAHTDNPYRDPTPAIQILHGLENDRESTEDGMTYLVDGFFAAEDLQRSAPEIFDLLQRESLPWRYSAADAHLTNNRPVFELEPSGVLRTVRFNNRSFGVLDRPDGRVEEIYAALTRFAAMIAEPERRIGATLSAGDLLVMDNWRMLHGRTAFRGGAKRWLQGGYIDRDSFYSRRGVLRRDLQTN